MFTIMIVAVLVLGLIAVSHRAEKALLAGASLSAGGSGGGGSFAPLQDTWQDLCNAMAGGWPGGAFVGPLDSLLQFMAAATLTATGDSTVLDLGVGYSPSPIDALGILINVTARDATTGNEAYSCEVWESDDNSSWTTTGLSFTVAAVGQYQKITGITKRYVKLIWTLGGTTPSLTADAWAITKP
jgi:hypothetical protein